MQSSDGAKQCVRWMRSLAATESVRRSRLGDDVLAFSAIRNASLRSQRNQLEVDGASFEDQLAAANAQIQALEQQVKGERALQDYFSSEHSKAEERAETAEIQARASAYRIQDLVIQLKQQGSDVDQGTNLPETWADFVNWCDVNLAGRLTLSPAARRSVRSPLFEDVPLAARCLLWLATVCREWRIGGGDGSLRDEAVWDGVRNAHCGSDQFDLDWQGLRYTADWHIKSGGNTHDPKRCLRIYYFWEPNSQQIVIADMPAHRRTAAT
jgi:hypothetical protein